ncbi:hypothetical protein A1Q2_01009 [Trichosporon asahii var. asahii CBS 8904]|uniref:Carboxylesterase type B domain-containing protein n=1 Tax=Trichosporon asahii var. asahii (strain CBS 8904) TaxID=1220162 RepID=K1WVB8_TRIAC|nr:hypothetical protein A1Q2_01009 [Trichosporon asahii var. asahii CBS 8904]
MKQQPYGSSYLSSMGVGAALQSALIFAVTLGLSLLLRYFSGLDTDRATGPCQLRWGGVTVEGYLGPNNVCRYSIQYSKTVRWGEPRSVTTDGSGLPPSCPQSVVFGSRFRGLGVPESEDCNYMLLFIPQNADASTPIFTWIHGGSNWMGSVSMPGLDGFALAGKGQIVVLPQYRLGLLGMMPPSSHPTSLDPNLAVRDLAFMLKTIHDNIGTQGNAGAITISGHSSGAAMLRSLWQVPSAPGLYHQVIVHSDPSVFPTSSMEQHKVVRDKVYSFNMFKGSKTLQSLKELDVRAFQHAIDQLMAWSGSVNTPTDILNPVFGTMTIPYEPTRALHGDGHLSVRPRDVPMLISTTKDDGGYVVSSNHHQPLSVALDSDGLSPFLRALAGRCANDPTSQPFISEEKYRIGSYTDGPDVGRVALTDIITDGAFRCVGRDTASHWAKAGGKTYVVEINDSAPYLWSSMVGNDWCIGRDDVPNVLGYDNGATPGLGDEVSDVWSAFIQGRSIGVDTYKPDANQQNTNVKVIGGGGGEAPNCPIDFWGTKCTWAWQRE